MAARMFRQICFHLFRSTDTCTSTFYWWFGLGRFKDSEVIFIGSWRAKILLALGEQWSDWLLKSNDICGFQISIGYQASFWESRKAYFPWFGLDSFYSISVWFIFWRNFVPCTYERYLKRQEPMKLSSGLFSNCSQILGPRGSLYYSLFLLLILFAENIG